MPAKPTAPDTLLSLFQSAARELSGLRHVDTAAAMMREAAHLASLRLQGMPIPTAAPSGTLGDVWTCARLGLAYLEARLAGDAAESGRLENELIASPCDPGWLTTLTAYLGYFGPGGHRRAIPYRAPGNGIDGIIAAPPSPRIALISDWGTGSPQASELLRCVAAQKPDILIHLGDIYYSGTAAECEAHFEQLIEAELGPRETRIPVFTLSGNHDMYSGGEGYYALIDRLNRDPMRQRASWFCLRSTDNAWQILAADTGLHDHDPFTALGDAVETSLDPAEEAWHLDRIAEFPGQTIMISHHPVFSAFYKVAPPGGDAADGAINAALLASLQRFQQAGRVETWFWGHEHSLCLYQPYAGLPRGRCVGNSAIPVFLSDQPYKTVAGFTDPPQIIAGTELGSDGTIYNRGFTVLTLGPTRSAAYYQHTASEPLFTESLA